MARRVLAVLLMVAALLPDAAFCDNTTAADTSTEAIATTSPSPLLSGMSTALDVDNATEATTSNPSDLANSTTTPSALLAPQTTPAQTTGPAISRPRDQLVYGCETTSPVPAPEPKACLARHSQFHSHTSVAD